MISEGSNNPKMPLEFCSTRLFFNLRTRGREQGEVKKQTNKQQQQQQLTNTCDNDLSGFTTKPKYFTMALML